MNKHWSLDLAIILFAVPCLFSVHNDIVSQYIQFADACSPRWSNALYYLLGMSNGAALTLIPLAFKTVISISYSFVDRFFPDPDQPKEVEL